MFIKYKLYAAVTHMLRWVTVVIFLSSSEVYRVNVIQRVNFDSHQVGIWTQLNGIMMNKFELKRNRSSVVIT